MIFDDEISQLQDMVYRANNLRLNDDGSDPRRYLTTVAKQWVAAQSGETNEWWKHIIHAGIHIDDFGNYFVFVALNPANKDAYIPLSFFAKSHEQRALLAQKGIIDRKQRDVIVLEQRERDELDRLLDKYGVPEERLRGNDYRYDVPR